MHNKTSQKRVLFGCRQRLVGLLVFVVLVITTIFSLVITVVQPSQVQAATNGQLNFQARLQTAPGAIVADGNYNTEFKLYSAATGGTALWTETYLNSNSQGIRVKNGYLTANLGSITTFPSTIDWDQELWITMTVRGTNASCAFAACTPTDAEMSPRLKLTGVPYAFRAGMLATGNGTLSSTLQLLQPTVGNQIFQIQDQGAAGTYTLLTNTSGIQLQAASPGTQQTGNFNISGTGIANTSLLTPLLDTATAVALNLGTTNATVINLNENTALAAGKTLSFANTTNANTVTLQSGVTAASYTLTLPTTAPALSQCLQNDGTTVGTLVFAACATGGSAITTVGTINSQSPKSADGATVVGSALILQTADSSFPGLVSIGTQSFAGNKTFTSGVLIRPTADVATAFRVQNVATQNLFQVDTLANAITLAATSTLVKPLTNSATSFQVQSNASAVPILNVDTTNRRVGIGTATPAADFHLAGTTAIFGTGEAATPTTTTIRGAAAAGSNIAGADFMFDASNGTGSGGSGDFVFRTASPATTDTITHDTTTTQVGGGNVSSLNWSHTTGSGSNRILVVGLGLRDTPSSVSGITYGAQNLTKIDDETSADGKAELWYLVAPNTGTATITVTIAGGATRVVAGSSTYSNVDPATPLGTFTAANGSSNAPSTTVSSATGELVIDVLSQDDAGAVMTPGANQTQRWTGTDGVNLGVASSYEAGASSVTMSWSLDGSENWAIIAVPLKPSGAGATSANTLTERLRISETGNITASGTYNTNTFTGSTLTFGAAGTATVQSATSQALNITANAASTFSTTAGNLTLQAGSGTVSLGTSTALSANAGLTISGGTTLTLNSASTNAVTLDSGTTGDVNVGTNANAKTVNVGNTTGATAVNIQAGTGNIDLITSGTGSGTVVKNNTNSANGFLVQNASSQNILQVETTTGNITLNGLNTGEPQPWVTGTALSTGAQARDNAAAVTYNGYYYIVAGNDGSTNQTTIAYNKLGANGSFGSTWATTGTSVPARSYHSVAVANGYLYIFGGTSLVASTDVRSEVFFAKINQDGTVGTFTATSSLTAARKSGTAVVLNGYVYYIGGDSSSTATPTAVSTVYYARLNADGTLGAWATSTNGIGAARWGVRGIAANGYLYAVGGSSGAVGSTAQTSIYYARPASSGNITSAWTTEATNPLPVAAYNGGVYAVNGYLYYAAGAQGAGTAVPSLAVAYAPLALNGSLGTWTTAGVANRLPAARETIAYAHANGYLYAVGGFNGGAQTAAYYTSLARTRLGGSLDLVNLGGETLADGGGTGGSLTAGNTAVLGTLQVTDGATFLNSVSIDKELTVGGSVSIRNTAGAASSFQLQDATNAAIAKFDANANFESIGYINNAIGGIGQFANLILYSEQFDNAAWTKTNVTAPTANTILAPDGRTTAESLATSASDGSVSQTSATAPTNANHTFSVWLKSASGTQSVDLRIDGATSGTGTRATVVATTTWQRVSVTQNTNGFTGNVRVLIFPGTTGGSGTVHAYGAQLVVGSNPFVYTRTTASVVAFSQGVVSNGGAFISSLNEADVPLIVQAAPGQTGDLIQVQSATGVATGGFNASGQFFLGQAGTTNSTLTLYNATNSNTVTIQSGVTSASYTLTLPTALGSIGECLKDTTGTGVLGFGACGSGGGGGSSTLQEAYANSGTANPQITFSNANGGLKLRDSASGVAGNLFQIQNNAGTATLFGLAATGLTLQDSSGNNAFIFDSSTSRLRVYANTTTPTLYAEVYYDDVAGEAVFAASTGNTRIGNGSGNVSIQLTNTADNLQFSKTSTLSAAYGGDEFSIIQNVTAGTNAVTGAVLKVEALTSGSNVSSNLLLINQSNTGTTGNLILATTGGAGNEKFKVNTAGTVTIAAGQAYTGVGAVQVTAGGSATLTLTSQAAATWSTASGDLTLQAGGASKVVVKPGTNSTASFQVQNAGSTAFLTADTSGSSIQIGSSTSDGTSITLVLDSYNGSGDPTGVNGAMYYNTGKRSLRCHNNGFWKDCDYASMRAEWTIQEDWANVSNATLTAGTQGWTFASIGTGGTITKVDVGADASDRDRLGVLRLNAPATATTGAHVRLDTTGMSGVPSNMTAEFDFAPVSSTAAAGLQQVIRIGLHDTANANAPIDGLYFQYSTTTTAGNWFRCTQATCVDTGVARTLTANQYQRFRIQTNSAGTAVEFFINETSVGTASANLPGVTASYGPAFNASTVDNNATVRTWKTDYFQLKRNLTTLR